MLEWLKHPWWPLIEGRFDPWPWSISMCRKQVSSSKRMYIAPCPPYDGFEVLVTTMPCYGIVMAWQDVTTLEAIVGIN